jgi:hypothetical protein
MSPGKFRRDLRFFPTMRQNSFKDDFCGERKHEIIHIEFFGFYQI